MEPRFSRALRTCVMNPSGKSSVRILQYGPRTRFVSGKSDGKLVLTNRFETRASRFKRNERVRFRFSKYNNRMAMTKRGTYNACKNDYQYRNLV